MSFPELWGAISDYRPIIERVRKSFNQKSQITNTIVNENTTASNVTDNTGVENIGNFIFEQ